MPPGFTVTSADAISAAKGTIVLTILSAIGAGGMDEVYKARDPRLESNRRDKDPSAYLADRAELREDAYERMV